MPSARKPPVSDLSALLKKLNEAGIEFILVDGLAAVVQGAPITTFDLDIVHHQSDENIKGNTAPENRKPITTIPNTSEFNFD